MIPRELEKTMEVKATKLRKKMLAIAEENPITLVFLSVYFVLTIVTIIVVNILTEH